MRKALIAVALVAGLSANAQNPDKLGMKIFTFSGIAGLTTGLQDKNVCASLDEICKVGDLFEKLDHGISRSFAFVDEVHQVRLQPSATYEIRKRKATGPATQVLVTEPIQSLNGAEIVFISASAPYRVAILLITPEMKGELIYDSVTKPTYLHEKDEIKNDTFEAISKVTVNSENSITLEEFSQVRGKALARKFRISFQPSSPPKLERL